MASCGMPSRRFCASCPAVLMVANALLNPVIFFCNTLRRIAHQINGQMSMNSGFALDGTLSFGLRCLNDCSLLSYGQRIETGWVCFSTDFASPVVSRFYSGWFV
ncbi:hypothetical protein BJ741DRAFT_633947 [Chytriomyces cf. hyalinus JEL632]|nr:hypothetical protein BJ741DRAFT_633947 [Chytriomyces cf. hyalinus JEL632]